MLTWPLVSIYLKKIFFFSAAAFLFFFFLAFPFSLRNLFMKYCLQEPEQVRVFFDGKKKKG